MSSEGESSSYKPREDEDLLGLGLPLESVEKKGRGGKRGSSRRRGRRETGIDVWYCFRNDHADGRGFK